MTAEAPNLSEQELDSALATARQHLALIRAQIQSHNVDLEFVISRLESVDATINTLMEQRSSRPDASRFAKLYEVSRAISSSLDLEEVLNAVMDAIILLTEAERGFLMLLNDDGLLEVRTARNFDRETLDSGEFAVSRTITQQVFELGQPVVTTNATEDPRYAAQASVMMHQLRSIMAVPLRSRGSIIGVVYVDNRIRAGLFRDSDLELLEAFAGQAAVALDNARLFRQTDERLSRRVDELQTLQWIDRRLNETLDVGKAMDLTVEWALRMCEAENATLAILNPQDGGLEMMAQAGENSRLFDNQAQEVKKVHPLVQQVLETNQARLQASAGESIFCVPIHRENNIVGVLLIFAPRENAFDAETQALLTRIADRAAIAIENGRLYNALKRANDAKSEFVGTVAHELKVPMTSIQGYADLLQQFSQLDNRSLDFVSRIRSSVMRMRTLVEDLSDISRIESGNLRVEITDVNIAEVVEVAKNSTLNQIEDREHQLVEDIAPNLPPIKADPARTAQILVNLLSNAYKYTPNGGTITLHAEQRSDKVYISVADTGVGLSAEELQKIGMKFWRSDNEHSLKQRGTGLGFSITRQLIDLMGGELEIESQAGVGSTFTVGLPISN